MEENDMALQLAMEQYAKLTIPWQKEKLLKKTKKDLANKKKAREEAREQKELAERARQMELSLKKAEEEYERMQSKQVMIDFLQEDGREALVAFFKIKHHVEV